MIKEKSFVHRIFSMILRAIGGLAFIVLISFLFGLIVQYLWNWTMPGMFGLKTITYWQGLALFILSKIIFTGHGIPHGYGHFRRRIHGSHHHGWGGKDRWGKWKYYNEYWKSEGKAAFEKYASEMEKKEKGEEK